MNPYESTKSAHTNSDPPVSATSKKLGPLIVCMMLILTVVVSILRLALPSIGTVTSPRFGSHGLIVFAGPLIFLVPWFWKPERVRLVIASLLLFMGGLLNAQLLRETGTVAVITNPNLDRLHSSWLWCVLPAFFAGAYLLWRAAFEKTPYLHKRNIHPED